MRCAARLRLGLGREWLQSVACVRLGKSGAKPRFSSLGSVARFARHPRNSEGGVAMGRAASARRGVSPVGRLAVGSALALAVSLGAPTVVAADPPEVPVGPAPIVGSFQVTPDAGPVGSTVTIHGFCGFPAKSIGAGLSSDA